MKSRLFYKLLTNCKRSAWTGLDERQTKILMSKCGKSDDTKTQFFHKFNLKNHVYDKWEDDLSVGYLMFNLNQTFLSTTTINTKS